MPLDYCHKGQRVSRGEVEQSMWQVHSVTRPRRNRSWLVVIAMIPALILRGQRLQWQLRTACSAGDRRQGHAVRRPCWCPKLQASVKDGAVGVAVDQPVTVTAGDGVLGLSA